MTQEPSAYRTGVLAAVSLVLGLLSPVLLFLTGVPAVLLGLSCLRTINRADGRLPGKKLAVAGMALGALGSLLGVAGLVALLLLRLQAQGARATCQNNLRTVGDALNNYHDHDPKSQFYPYAAVPNDDLAPKERLSWLVEILPFMKRDGLYKEFDLQLAWDAEANRRPVRTVIPTFLCPNSPNRGTAGEPGLTTYVGIAGLGKNAADLRDPFDPRAGVFGYDRRVSKAMLQDEDEDWRRRGIKGRGTSEVMLVAETAEDNGPWAAGGTPTVRGLEPDRQPYIGPGRPWGGLHKGGLFVLFADGSVRFIMEGVAPAVFEAHATVVAPAGD